MRTQSGPSSTASGRGTSSPYSSVGFSLIELLIALALGSLAIVGALSLVTNLAMAHVKGQKELSAEMGALTAARQAERELRQTTILIAPLPSTSGPTLEGCANAVLRPGDAAPSALDVSAPLRGYAFCSAAGVLYYHSSASCPPSYSCGSGGVPLAGSPGRSSASTSFTRTSARSALVEVDIAITAGTAIARARTSAAAAFSPGMLP